MVSCPDPIVSVRPHYIMRQLTIIILLLVTVTRAEDEECPDFECPVKGELRYIDYETQSFANT